MRRRAFLQVAGAGAVAGAAELLASQPAQRATPAAGRPAILTEYPALSLKERDRRWNRARTMMQDAGVDYLLVIGHGADNWFTNDAPAVVVFPLQGDPVALCNGSSQAGNWLQNEERGEISWVRDWRFQDNSGALVSALRELGVGSTSRIGTIGVSAVAGSKTGRFGGGIIIAHEKWIALSEAFPNARWQELWTTFMPIWLTKSAEELPLFRKAAAIAEVACEATVAATRPGMTEADVFAVTQSEIMRWGGRTSGQLMHTGPDNVSWGTPKWLIRPQKPRTIQEGDVINIEMFPAYGSMEAQAQLCIAVGKVADVNHRLATIAREAYDAGLKTARPGITFGELANAMNVPNQREGAWLLTPHIHSLNPNDPVGPDRKDRFPGYTAIHARFKDLPLGRSSAGFDLVLQPGMTFELEPNANLGRQRVNIGGNIIITEKGCEALNTIPCEMRAAGTRAKT